MLKNIIYCPICHHFFYLKNIDNTKLPHYFYFNCDYCNILKNKEFSIKECKKQLQTNIDMRIKLQQKE